MRSLFYTLFIFAISLGIYGQAFALTVSPARVELVGDLGQTITGEIEILNEQEGIRNFFSSTENFEPSGESGAPLFVGGGKGLASWIKVDSEIVLESQETKLIPFSISIPQNTEPGGYFAAIFFGSQPIQNQGGGEVSIGGKIGVLVLLRVSGDVAEGGGLLEFSTKDKQKFFTTLPISFNYRINNTGGDRIVPLGEIKIKNTFGFTSGTISANKNQGSVLPDSARKFEVLWQEKKINESSLGSLSQPNESEEVSGFFGRVVEQWKNFHFGWYAAEIDLSWSATNQTAEGLYDFFIIPWQLMIVVFLILIIAGFVGLFGLRKYNRWIISKAIQQQK